MAAIVRKSHAYKIPAGVTLATADDLDGTSDGTQYLTVSGKARVLYIQHNNGTAGTAGIDCINISKDGGVTWGADDTLLALASDDTTGTIVANGALNAAGVEPVNMAVFKGGPYHGQVMVRCARKAADDANSVAWVTGAPSVTAIVIG